jgi:hypothetical protein
MSTIEYLKEFLIIDKNHLDEAIEVQAEIFYHVADGTAQAVSERDQIKYELDTLLSDTYLAIRLEATEEGRKITEALLENEVAQDKDVQKLKEKYLEVKANAEKWLALKESFTQRGYMLREMASLYVSGYFAEISVRSSTDTEEIQQQARRERMSTRRKERAQL